MATQFRTDLSGDQYNPAVSHGLFPNIPSTLQGLGYSEQPAFTDSGSALAYLQTRLTPEEYARVSRPGGNPNNGNPRDNLGIPQAQTQQAMDWLQNQGMGVKFVDNGLEHVQQLVGKNGAPLAEQVYNYNDTNRGVNQLGMAGALMMIGAPYLQGAMAGAGTGTLGAGASGAGSAGLTASLPSSAELLGGLTSSSSLFNPIALAPSLGAGAGITAGIGAADMGGLSSAGLEASGWAAPISGAQSSAGLGSFGTLGAGAGAPSVTTPGISAADTAGIGLSNTAPLTGVPSTVGGGGLLGSIANSGVGQAVGQVADLVGGGQNLAGIVGGLLGATQGGQSQTATTQSRTEPRFDPYLYGDNGFLSQLQQQFNATKSGTNADITAGQNMLRDLYTSPAYTQGYQDMRSAGQGLLGRSIAGNPFTMASPPQFGRNSPAMQQSPENPFMGMFAQTQTMPQRGLLNPFGG